MKYLLRTRGSHDNYKIEYFIVDYREYPFSVNWAWSEEIRDREKEIPKGVLDKLLKTLNENRYRSEVWPAIPQRRMV